MLSGLKSTLMLFESLIKMLMPNWLKFMSVKRISAFPIKTEAQLAV